MAARRVTVSVVALLLLLGVACGGGGSEGDVAGTNTWVGKVEGTDAFIAMIIQDTARLVYTTDGKDFSLLFRGRIGETGANYFTFRDEANRLLNMRAPQGTTYTGIITLGPGQNLSFRMTPARGEAGLYRAKETTGGETWEKYWIVLEDGEVRGARISEGGRVEGLATRGGMKWTDPLTDP